MKKNPCKQSALILKCKNAFEAGYWCTCEHYKEKDTRIEWLMNPFDPGNTNYEDFAEGKRKRQEEETRKRDKANQTTLRGQNETLQQ